MDFLDCLGLASNIEHRSSRSELDVLTAGLEATIGIPGKLRMPLGDVVVIMVGTRGSCKCAKQQEHQIDLAQLVEGGKYQVNVYVLWITRF